MTQTLEEKPINNKINNKLNIKIKESDLQMQDLDLYLKTYTEYINKNNVEDFEELKLEITRCINIVRGRDCCENCDYTGFVYNQKCLLCNGHGHHNY